MKCNKAALLVFPLLYSISALAQSPKSYLKIADRAFAESDYYTAEINYKKAIETDSSRLDIINKLAESARLVKDYKVAEHYYKFLLDKDKTQPLQFPMSLFHLAMMKKYNGKYAEAKKLFKSYASKHKAENDYYAQKAKYEMNAMDAALNLSKISEKINVVHMDTSVNSTYNEVAPYQLGDSIFYFTSQRTEFKLKDPKEKEEATLFLSKIYKSIRRGDSLWLNTRELTPMFNAAGMNNGNAAFSPDQKRFYFVRSKPTMEGEGVGVNELYVSEFKGGKWQLPVRLNDPVNAAGYTTTNPCVVPSGKKGDFLFFSSNRPGGKGKFDIWVCTVSPDGKYSQPTNLGDKINSIDDEVTPFFDITTQTLYFSSEWHKGLGGFDVFKSQKSGNEWSEPKNLGFPINTSYNDLYFNINKNTKDGYFVSNRPGTLSTKGETCCNDIYFFEFPDIKARLDSIKRMEELARESVKELDKMTPVTLFFDNDGPDPNNMDSVTNLNYETTVRDYISLRKDFEAEYSKGLTGPKKDQAIKEITDLFDNYISKGMTRLEKFCELMEKVLSTGRSIKITVKGFTSPLAMDEYNYSLAKRRVKSLINYMKEYNHSVFEKYMSGSAENGAKLQIIEQPVGESEASKAVSDNPNDQKGAVYSRAASFERKIQITDVIISEPPKPKK